MISLPEHADRAFPATIEFSSQAVDGQSGTTRMQLIVGNDEGLLLAGAYANVRIDLSREVQSLHIPAAQRHQNRSRPWHDFFAAANGRNPQTILVEQQRAGRDIEIAAGLAAEDRVIVNPPDGLVDGTQVRISKSGSQTAPQR